MTSPDYTHLLLAVDFEPESEPVVARALALRERHGARLSLLHVVEHVPAALDYMPVGLGGEVSVPDDLALEQELLGLARDQMAALGERLGVPEADRLVRTGSTGAVIDEVGQEIGADLIVIGSRGRHGLLGLFGSTAKSVLRSATCDVLCVRIAEQRA